MNNDEEILKKNKGGAPKKLAANKLSNKITVNFSDLEKEKLLELSKKKRKPITSIIRDLLIDNQYI